MRRVRHSKSGLFLIELMICILFFAFTAGICIRFFVKSHQLSQDAKNLYQAQQEASSMAEILEKDIDAVDGICVYYDKDWKQCDEEHKVYWLEVTEQADSQKLKQQDTETESQSTKQQDPETAQSSTQSNVMRVKIAVYSGSASQKEEIYHLNLSIYVPQENNTEQSDRNQKNTDDTEQKNNTEKGETLHE